MDWAYAKRALARGDDPETVVAKIADYRADDKADPDYYARLTVTKAIAQLHSQRSRDSETAAKEYAPQNFPESDGSGWTER